MTQQQVESAEAIHHDENLMAGLLIGLGSLLSVLIMAHHPSINAERVDDAIVEIGRVASLSRLVHGGLIALMGCVLFGFTSFAGHLGWGLAPVRAGMSAHALGAPTLLGAA